MKNTQLLVSLLFLWGVIVIAPDGTILSHTPDAKGKYVIKMNKETQEKENKAVCGGFVTLIPEDNDDKKETGKDKQEDD